MPRDFRLDQPKTISQFKKDIGKTCNVVGCTNGITHMQGPGQDSYCREHQLILKEYGGPARPDRPHTFHRTFVCSMCNENAKDYVNNHPRYKDCTEEEKLMIAWMRMHGDHRVRKADGGDDSASNVQSVCRDCHDVKTVRNKDYLKRKTIIDD